MDSDQWVVNKEVSLSLAGVAVCSIAILIQICKRLDTKDRNLRRPGTQKVKGLEHLAGVATAVRSAGVP